MDVFKDAFKNFSPAIRAIAKNTKSTINNLKTHKQYDYVEADFWSEFTEIVPRVYYIPFPTEPKISVMSSFLNKTFGPNYYIWNISEHSYDISKFNNQVAEHIVVGYPSPTLNQIFLISKSILSWLNSDKDNIALVHCQESKGRSAVLLSCLMCLMKKFTNPVEALTFFCAKTKTNENSILFPSNTLYLKYFSNILDGFKPNNKPVKMLKIMFSDIIFPKIKKNPEIGVLEDNTNIDDDEKIFRPYLQIFKNSEIIYNSLTSDLIEEAKCYRKSDISCWFNINCEVFDDILIRCKHFYSNEIRYPIFRVMMSTGFVFDNVMRFYKRDIDFSSHSNVDDNFFIDIFFDVSSDGKNSDNNLDYIVNECNKHAENFKRKSHCKSPNSKPTNQQHMENKLDKKENSPKNSNKEEHQEENKVQAKKVEELVEATSSSILTKIMKTIDEDHDLDDQDIDQYINNVGH